MFNLFVLALLTVSVVESDAYDEHSGYVCCNQPPTYSPPRRGFGGLRSKRGFKNIVARMLDAGRDRNALAELDPTLGQELEAKASFLKMIRQAAALRDYVKDGDASEVFSSRNTPDISYDFLTSPDVETLPRLWNDKREFVAASGGAGGINING